MNKESYLLCDGRVRTVIDTMINWTYKRANQVTGVQAQQYLGAKSHDKIPLYAYMY